MDEREIKADRSAVYAALDSERNYQLKRWGLDDENQPPSLDGMEEPAHTPDEFLLYMEHYMHEARVLASTTPEGNPGVLDMMRKVVALGIACFEQHGILHRPDGPVKNGRTGRMIG